MQNTADPSPLLTLPPHDGGWKQGLWAALGMLMFGAMLVAAGIYTAPSLISDWQIRDTAVPVAGARVADGSCSSRLFFNVCNATLSAQTKFGMVSRRVNQVFTDLHPGNYSVTVLADPAQPELLTTDIAIQKLWNRTITLLAGGGFLLAVMIAPVVALFRRVRRH